MDAFLRTHRSFVLSALYLTVALILLGYAWFYSPREVAMADAVKLAAALERENQPLRAEIARRAAAEKSPAESLRSLPTFLNRINSIAKGTSVIIKELMPSRDGNLKFVIKIAADYLTFLRFAAGLESLNVSINDLQVRPFDPSKIPPVHAIEFSITPRADGEELSDARLNALAQEIAKTDKRNPFQRFAFNPKGQIEAEIDLTWLHRLNGVGRAGDRKIATINNRDYIVGDELEPSMRITGIENDYVRLERTGGEGVTKYLLRYRRSKLDKPQ